MKYKNVKREEELKGKVGKDWFSAFDDTRILGNIDFCVSPKKQRNKKEPESLLWAEAKTKDFDTVAMFAQLIITIGKERTFDKHLPPTFLGAFDYKKFVFIPYNEVSDLFYTNDFNWNVAPSNHETKEFLLIKTRIEHVLQGNKYSFDYEEDEKELKHFIKHNLTLGSDEVKILIDKNNFVPIYLRWLTQVKPYIDFDWEIGKKNNIQDSDFFLADLFVDDKGTATIEDDTPIKDELLIVFRSSRYEIAKEFSKSLFHSMAANISFEITDKTKYEQFWKKYRREPLQEFQQYIIDRRDLLIPQDVRERKGAFFTPQIWVELSQKYLADVLGEEWQAEYYIWDCAAGTGNLLVGLTNKYNIWASTLDQADVNVMHERIKNGANLLSDHVFQFDFLNDDFSKLPKNLQNVINDPEKRKKLVIYINPPYAEVGGNIEGQQKNEVQSSKIHDKYSNKLGKANRELFAQFFIRLYEELNGILLAEFSKLKVIQSPNFSTFRKSFKAKLNKLFIVPADTFDNVKGKFPIGFFIWDTKQHEYYNQISADIYDEKGLFVAKRKFHSYDNCKYINDFFRKSLNLAQSETIGWLRCNQNDFQSQSTTFIVTDTSFKYLSKICAENLIIASIYYAVRKSIEATWLNDRDQFLFPNDGWEKDNEFQNDCLAFTLFSNNIQSQYGTNHWIPYTEQEVNSRAKFESSFMTDFIKGKHKPEPSGDLFSKMVNLRTTPLVFSPEATAVFDAGRELWNYYHSFKAININASLYDIREHFQGRNDKGKMNNKSEDQTYMQLISNLRTCLKDLAGQIAPKVYEYGFLKE